MDKERIIFYKKKGLIFNEELWLFQVFFIDQVVETVSVALVEEAHRQGTLDNLVTSIKDHVAHDLGRKLVNL